MSIDALPTGDARYRHLMEQAGDGIFLLDEHFRITEVNRAAEMMLGYAHGELHGHAVTDVILPEELAAEPPRLDELRRGGVILRERTLVRRDGSHLQVEVHTRRIAPGFYFGIARDLTERKVLEARVRQAEKLKAIGLLAGGVAHDFNNLLTVIRGHCELLLSTVPPEAAATEDLEAIRAAAVRASRLTGQLLAFGRRQVLQPEVLDLNVLIDEVLPMLRRLVGADVLLSPDLMPAPARVRIDRSQFEQLLINLCSNARDAMPRGGVIEVRTARIPCPRGRHGRRDVVLEVSDSGHGMAASISSRIFEPFFTTKPLGEGTGLGLAIVHGIVAQSGGTIECTSTPGRGTTFRMLFDEAEEPEARSVSDRVRTTPSRGCETILIVDDDETIVHVIGRALSQLGYLTIKARGVADALALADEMQAPELALIDLVLTDGTGTALARTLATRWPGTAVLYMTGYADDGLHRRGIVADGLALLAKPFDTPELAERVRAALDGAIAASGVG